MKIYMLDTCICSFIMRERPLSLIEKFSEEVNQKNHIVISAITYSEMRYGQIGKKASPKHRLLIDEFVLRLNEVVAWDAEAIDEAVKIKEFLAKNGTIISNNDIAIAGHAVALDSILVTNNLKEFNRVPNLHIEDWSNL